MLVGAIAAGQYGVDLFFVLSSYLITELLVREKEQCGTLNVGFFYLRRILRIWPLYYFILLLTITVNLFDPTHAFGLKYIFPFLLLSGNWGLVVFGWPEHVAATPLWSVSVEEQFYLLWPPVVARLSRKGIVYAALGMIAVANIVRVVMLLTSATAMELWGNTFAHLDSIAAGILIAILLGGKAPTVSTLVRAMLIICGITIVSLRGYFQSVSGVGLSWGTVLFGWPATAVSCALILVAFIGSKVTPPWLRYLGKISYGLYAYHVLCIMVVDKVLTLQRRFAEHSLIHAGLREVLSLALTIGVSAISYAALEKPFLQLKEKFTRVHSRPV
jgi:peptidoglycan/LPS O-acetylase OafA/YrhL